MNERLYLFDTTQRDGQQTQGLQFSTAEKVQIAAALDALGVDYIEGGWLGANPTDSDFFAQALRTRFTMTAFGMTKRAGPPRLRPHQTGGAPVTPGTPAPGLTRGLRQPREAPDQVRGGHPDQVRGGVASSMRNVKSTLTRPRNPLKLRARPDVPQWADRKGYPA